VLGSALNITTLPVSPLEQALEILGAALADSSRAGRCLAAVNSPPIALKFIHRAGRTKSEFRTAEWRFAPLRIRRLPIRISDLRRTGALSDGLSAEALG